MLQYRVHRVMGKLALSVWCLSHGPAHCLWSSSSWTETDDFLDLADAVSLGARAFFRHVFEGRVEYTDECGL